MFSQRDPLPSRLESFTGLQSITVVKLDNLKFELFIGQCRLNLLQITFRMPQEDSVSRVILTEPSNSFEVFVTRFLRIFSEVFSNQFCRGFTDSRHRQ